MTVIELDRSAASRGAEQLGTPGRGAIHGASTELTVETPGIALFMAIRHMTAISVIAETLGTDRTVVLVAVSETSPATVRPIYDAEVRVREQFPKARFDVRVTRFDIGWDPAELPDPTRVLLYRS